MRQVCLVAAKFTSLIEFYTDSATVTLTRHLLALATSFNPSVVNADVVN